MDPLYMDNREFDTLNIAPLQKKSSRIKAGLDLLRLVRLLALDKS